MCQNVLKCAINVPEMCRNVRKCAHHTHISYTYHLNALRKAYFTSTQDPGVETTVQKVVEQVPLSKAQLLDCPNWHCFYIIFACPFCRRRSLTAVQKVVEQVLEHCSTTRLSKLHCFYTIFAWPLLWPRSHWPAVQKVVEQVLEQCSSTRLSKLHCFYTIFACPFCRRGHRPWFKKYLSKYLSNAQVPIQPRFLCHSIRLCPPSSTRSWTYDRMALVFLDGILQPNPWTHSNIEIVKPWSWKGFKHFSESWTSHILATRLASG